MARVGITIRTSKLDAQTMQLRYRRGSIRSMCSIFWLDEMWSLTKLEYKFSSEILPPHWSGQYSYVQQEESRRNSMLYPVTQNRSTMIASLHKIKALQVKVPPAKMISAVTAVTKTKHTRETCRQLHRRPNRGRGGKIQTLDHKPMWQTLIMGGLNQKQKTIWVLQAFLWSYTQDHQLKWQVLP